MLIFAPSNHKCGKNKGAASILFFMSLHKRNSDRNRVGKWKHPQGIALMSLTARSTVFLFICLNHKCYE